MQDLKKRQTEEESQREDLQNEIERILEESSEGMDALDDEDVVSSKSCFLPEMTDLLIDVNFNFNFSYIQQ
jgi:hypothetical protein